MEKFKVKNQDDVRWQGTKSFVRSTYCPYETYNGGQYTKTPKI